MTPAWAPSAAGTISSRRAKSSPARRAGRARPRVARAGGRHEGGDVVALPALLQRAGEHRRAARVRLHAAARAAGAGRAVEVDGDVPDVAGVAGRPREGLAVQHEAA